MGRHTKPTDPEPRVGVNVRIPRSIHRAARVACAERGITWDQAAAEALDAWVRRRSVQKHHE